MKMMEHKSVHLREEVVAVQIDKRQDHQQLKNDIIMQIILLQNLNYPYKKLLDLVSLNLCRNGASLGVLATYVSLPFAKMPELAIPK
jgi:hypothetical protein